MVARMDDEAARAVRPETRAEWTRMAVQWRGMASHADWQDVYARA